MNAVIAVNPQQMQEAQTQTTAWIIGKLESARRELVDAEAVANSLSGANLRRGQAAGLVRRARQRVGFYEKVQKALELGYYIIPPFDIQLFAIRTDRLQSPDDVGTWRGTKDHEARSLPAGEGRFVNPNTKRHELDRYTENVPGTDKTREVVLFQNDDWGDVEIPVRALKPQLIEAVGKALHEKVFDALGIAPAYRAADPIIAGQIKRPDKRGQVLTFFVAWWLDEKDL